MGVFLSVVNLFLPLLYLALVIDYGITFFLGVRTHVRTWWAGVVIGVHGLFLLLLSIHLGYPPLVASYEVLSVMAVSAAVLYWGLELVGRDRRAGLFVFGAIFLFQYVSSIFLGQTIAADPPGPVAQNAWARLHVVPAVLAYVGLTFAGIYGLLHLLAQRNLKQHRFGLLFDRLPPLEMLGRMTWFSLLIGFAFMTVCIATGPFLLAQEHAAEASRAWGAKVMTKTIIGSVAWAICFVAVAGRAITRWSITRVARIAVAGFLVVMVLLATSAVLS